MNDSCHRSDDDSIVSETDTTNSPQLPRCSPCATCPYRVSVESGVWESSEYDKLEQYDDNIAQQVTKGGTRVFSCHQGDGRVCSGWLGHRDPLDLLAVRLGLMDGRLDMSCAEYSTDVPLFETGHDAAEHGRKRIESPSEKAQRDIQKIIKKRGITP